MGVWEGRREGVEDMQARTARVRQRADGGRGFAVRGESGVDGAAGRE